jgi:hypothetical protein
VSKFNPPLYNMPFLSNSLAKLSNKSLMATVGGLFMIYLYYNRRRALSEDHAYAHLPLPPGPTPIPVLGNAPQFPTSRSYETFSSWVEKYGDMIYMNVLGKRMIVINSLDVAKVLLEKRGGAYSNRAGKNITLLG